MFDAAFDLFFSRPGGEGKSGSIPGRSRPLALDPKQALAWMNALGLSSPGVAREVEGPPASSTGYSAEELLRQRDFREMSWDELAAVRRLLRQSPWRVAERRTRRLRADRRGTVELRRTMRAAARQGGDAPRLARASTRTKRRPIVILCDVSGSMDRYSRHLLVFAHAIGRRERVETFAFSTHLTRITHLLRHGDIDSALDHVAEPGARHRRRDAHRRRAAHLSARPRTPGARSRRDRADHQRRLGPGRPRSARSRDGPAPPELPPADLAQPAAREQRIPAGDARHGRCAPALRRLPERAQRRCARRPRPAARASCLDESAVRLRGGGAGLAARGAAAEG